MTQTPPPGSSRVAADIPQTSATEWSRIRSRLLWQFLCWVCFMAFCGAGEGSDTCALRPPTDHQSACPVELEELRLQMLSRSLAHCRFRHNTRYTRTTEQQSERSVNFLAHSPHIWSGIDLVQRGSHHPGVGGREIEGGTAPDQRAPRTPELQCAWLLLALCAIPSAEVARYAASHDTAMWETFLSGVEGSPEPSVSAARQVAALPAALGGLGLQSAARESSAAYWAPWADALLQTRRLSSRLSVPVSRNTASRNSKDPALA